MYLRDEKMEQNGKGKRLGVGRGRRGRSLIEFRAVFEFELN